MVEVETTLGVVRGARQGVVNVFRGIPYARPPMGGLRFRGPQGHPTWSGSLDATQFGPPAPQNPDRLDHIWGGLPVPPGEDCLTLNVWTPGLDGARRPVMVWIHGGAFVIGSGSESWFEGTRLAKRGDVVVVTINYRLGSFGFLDLSEVGGPGYEESVNCGLLDQVAALEWIRDNVERFGGDARNVTVFGESAGAISICCLMAMPAARGLFHRAIVQSGGANLVRSREVSRAVAREFLRSLGVRHVDQLRTLPMRALLKEQARFLDKNEFGGDLVFGPVVDGVRLPEPPLHAIRSGSARDVALMVGTTADEARLWSLYAPILRWTRPRALERVLTHVVGDRWREVVAAYRRSYPGESAGNLTMAIMGDVLFRMPAIRLAEAQHVHRPADTRMYLFAWATPAFRGQLGSPHAVDVPFVFGNLDARGADRYTGHGDHRRDLAEAVQDAWVAFARSADPNHPRLPFWPPYSPGARATFVFDQTHTIQDDPLGEGRGVWGDVPFDGCHPSIECSIPTTREILRSFVPFLTSD